MKAPRTQRRSGKWPGTAKVIGLGLVMVAAGALAITADLAGIQLAVVVLLVPVVMMLVLGDTKPSDEYPGSYDGHYDDHQYDEHDHGYHYRGRS
ncbi:hypothetical protein [Nocardioides pelophilus]|uniref:hypothetical protein n=1 Tax=Nocardioides pelophilus TaxID=2172019 RepID=UPI0016030825|nr:hypothetical protein [Nocardioides pelophilus]